MLRVTPLKGRSASSVIDYLKHLRQGEATAQDKAVGYYSKEAPSRWLGQGAAALGLHGEVRDADLKALLEGQVAGTDLTKRGGRQSAARMGTDLTFSAPKSFSLLATADPRLLEAWDEAVKVGVGVIEREVLVSRRGKGGAVAERTGKLVAAAFTHEDTRGVGGMPDPDIHSHVLAINATQRPDGTWTRSDLQFGDRMVLAKTADFAMKADLAKRVQGLGYKIRQTEHGFEFAAITDDQIGAFSRRSQQIDDWLIAKGLDPETATDAQKEAACLATRGAKGQLSQEDQRWEWRGRIREAGIGLDAIVAEARSRGPIETPDLTAEAVKSAARHLSERETVFSKNQARLEALRAGLGGVSIDTVEAALKDGAGGTLAAGEGRITTKEALYREQDILARARAGQGQTLALMTAEQADTYIRHREKAQGFAFSAGQRDALALSLTTHDRLVGVVGAAGAGKTTSMAGFAESVRAGGYEVVGLAPSAAAANELKGARIDDTRTLASLLASPAEAPTTSGKRFYVLDEAGMVSARDMDRFIQRAEAEGARVLMVGDPRQLAAVEAGTPFQQMLDTDAIAHANIDEIQRQRDPEMRAMVECFAKGDAAGGVARARRYVQQSAVLDGDWQAAGVEKPRDWEEGARAPAPVRRAALARAVADDYLNRDNDKRDKTLVLSGTNSTRRLINDRIRAGMGERETVTVTVLDKADMTREQMARAQAYKPGMVVRTSRKEKGQVVFEDREVMRVEGERVITKDQAGNEHEFKPHTRDARPDRVYQPRSLDLASGDRIVFRENHQIGKERIRNGVLAEVLEATPDKMRVRLDDKREIDLDPRVAQALDHGWALTVHMSQGKTFDHAIVAGEAIRKSAGELAYVGMSRQRETLAVHTDDWEKLGAAWQKFAEKEHAMAATQQTHTPDRDALAALRAEASQERGQEGDLSRAREEAEAQAEAARQAAQEREQQAREREAELERG